MKKRSGGNCNKRRTVGCVRSKKAQMKISFGMIFSIMLIVSFLAFGFFAIQKFLGMQENIIMKKFVDDFQNDIDKMWKSTQGSKEIKYTVPKDITLVCFEYNPYYNTLIYSGDIYVDRNFKKIDMNKTLGTRDSVCAKAKEGKITFYLEKQFGAEDVTIKV